MKEIERKFLVKPELFPKSGSDIIIKQGYLSVDPDRVVRIRREGNKAWITIKGRVEGITRPEFEYRIPVADAEELFRLVLPHPIEKIRHRVVFEGIRWEVDEFLGNNKGLLLAEVELEKEDQPYSHPEWLGEEVTNDPRYYNARLSQKPYSDWE